MQHWKSYRLYFTSAPLQRLAYVAGMLFFFGLMFWVLPQSKLWMEALACGAVGIFCIMELMDLVVVTPQWIGHYRYFTLSKQIPWTELERIAVTMEGKRPLLYFYGAGMHFSADQQKRLWQATLEKLELPSEIKGILLSSDVTRDYVETCQVGERSISIERRFVWLDRLMGKKAFVTYEIRIQYPEREKEPEDSKASEKWIFERN